MLSSKGSSKAVGSARRCDRVLDEEGELAVNAPKEKESGIRDGLMLRGERRLRETVVQDVSGE